MTPKPEQPFEHETQCPCYRCEEWAYALIAWEREEVAAGRDPWVSTA